MEGIRTEDRRRHPVFDLVKDDGRNLAWLARKLGYSHSHVRGVACGQWPAGEEFRRRCVDLLGLSEGELFHPNGTEPKAVA